MVDINWALIAPILIIEFILLLVAIVDLVKVKETNGPKWLWAIIIVLVSILGPVLYFIIGRRSR
ncbi:PLD nuclease N-terminal domain-containing protein [Paucisalibacillus globulus]|uniref:PLD nuclease N-terminal domain-containing protein n=1 Tax=Paucisalibacillus globulus TaxID=351095 RepID=UPI000BB6D1EC|nr:PLD nuclease N-terminal domain-containing protein [Paucisalibacillus globulus]